MMDTLVWLANFPATNGYATVFIAGFAAMGLLGHLFRRPRKRSQLEQMRRDAGKQPSATDHLATAGSLAVDIAMRVVALVVLGAGVIGAMSLGGGPVTSEYIYEHGLVAPAVLEDGHVVFTATDGLTYRQPLEFFTPAVHPEARSVPYSSDSFEVRYLERHPQAFVVDTDSIED